MLRDSVNLIDHCRYAHPLDKDDFAMLPWGTTEKRRT
jgi:hypothetical protein